MRKFTILDAMIVIAVAAVAIIGYKMNDEKMTTVGFFRGNDRITNGWEMLIGPGLASMTIGVVLMRTRSKCPPRIELFRQSGFVAAFVALSMTTKCFVSGYIMDNMADSGSWFLELGWFYSIRESSISILIVWLMLALAGCLKFEKSWVNRVSFIVAIIWVLAGITSQILPFLQESN